MTYCANCGTALADGGAFCGSCGAPAKVPTVAAAATAAAAMAPSAAPQAPFASSSTENGITMNLAAALSYALGLITGVIFLVLEPYKSNKFVRFHAMQSVLFSAAWVIFWITWSIVWGILENIMGWWLISIHAPLSLLIGLGVFLLWLYLMFQAYSQREFRLPWIGDIAAKQLP